jgi:hypothetical protein
MMTAVVLADGRRRAVDREQLETMNNPMHRRPRRRPESREKKPDDDLFGCLAPATTPSSVAGPRPEELLCQFLYLKHAGGTIRLSAFLFPTDVDFDRFVQVLQRQARNEI